MQKTGLCTKIIFALLLSQVGALLSNLVACRVEKKTVQTCFVLIKKQKPKNSADSFEDFKKQTYHPERQS
jgi:hypothetical protein